jgi:hypothetical protein
VETGHIIFVVVYKNEWRLSHQHFSVPGDADIEKLKPMKDMKRRRDERPQFPAFEPMLFRLAQGDNVRINSETRIVDKNPTVHFRDIHGDGVMVDHYAHRALEMERNPQIPGKMIERPERQHAQCYSGAGYLCGDSADGSVASGGYNRFFISRDGLTGNCAHPLSLGNENLRMRPDCTKQCSDLRPCFTWIPRPRSWHRQ